MKFCRVVNIRVHERDLSRLENGLTETLWNLIRIDIKSCIWDVLTLCTCTTTG